MKVICFAVGLLSAIVVDAAQYLSNKPDFLRPCRLDDAAFENCFAANFQVLFSQWKNGIPGAKSLGKLDPLEVKRVKIQQDSGTTLKLNIDLHNVLITGASGAIIKKASFDLKNLVTTVELFVPKVRFTADYKVKGQILALNLDGKGETIFQTDNAIMHLKIQMKAYDADNFTFTDIEKIQIVIKNIDDFYINLNNLFNGQKELEDAANMLFNENWRTLFELMRPAITQTIEAVLLDRLKKTFNYVPVNYFIADFPKAAEYNG